MFLLTVGFVFSVLPGVLAPFDGARPGPALADRVADDLTQRALGEADDPTALDEACVRAFFGSGAATGCPFRAGESLSERVGIDAGNELNVTVERTGGGGVLCLTADGEARPCAGGGGGTRLVAGEDPPVGKDVVSSTRLVRVGGTDAVVVVRLW